MQFVSSPPNLPNLLPREVRLRSMPIAANVLPAVERALVSRAVPKRQREFATGRVLARSLLHDLGVEVHAIGQSQDRTAIWPEGIVGSISHCDDLCVAAVGRKSDGIRSVGIDVESADPLPRELWEEVARDTEAANQVGNVVSHGIAMRRLFSAKEAFYKCVFPVIKQNLEFHDVEVNFSRRYERFSAMVMTSTIDCIRDADSIEGRQCASARWIISATIWRR